MRAIRQSIIDPQAGAKSRTAISPATLAQVLRYVSIGGISAVVELGLFHVAAGVAGLPIMTANIIAVASVMVFGFIAQKRFTFHDTQKGYTQAGLYALMVAISIGLNNALVFIFAVLIGIPPTLAKALQLGASFAFNFSFSKYIVFRRHG